MPFLWHNMQCNSTLANIVTENTTKVQLDDTLQIVR